MHRLPRLESRLWRAALAAMPLAGVGALVVPTTAGGDSVAGLQAMAAQLSRQLNLEQAQLASDQERYLAASQRAWQDEQAVAAVQDQIGQVQARTQADGQHLRRVAINAYVDNGTQSDAVSALFVSAGGADEARSVYAQVASGDISVEIDQLQTDRQLLQAREIELQRISAQSQADQAEAASILGQAQNTARQLAQQNSEVTGQLAVALAQQRAAQAAAAQAALQQANARVRQNHSTTSAGTGGGGIGAWQRVATCEEGGNNDATYGYFGITPQSWAAYGGTQYSATAGGASQAEQVLVANRISGGAVPDAAGCASW